MEKKAEIYLTPAAYLLAYSLYIRQDHLVLFAPKPSLCTFLHLPSVKVFYTVLQALRLCRNQWRRLFWEATPLGNLCRASGSDMQKSLICQLMKDYGLKTLEWPSLNT